MHCLGQDFLEFEHLTRFQLKLARGVMSYRTRLELRHKNLQPTAKELSNIYSVCKIQDA